MLYIIDYKTDESDDLVITGGALLAEADGYMSAIKTGERRCSARYDDFPLDDCGAGLERYIYQEVDAARYNIRDDIDRVMVQDGLFSISDFDIIIPKTNQSVLQPFIKINSKQTNSNGFRIIVDQINQQSYR